MWNTSWELFTVLLQFCLFLFLQDRFTVIIFSESVLRKHSWVVNIIKMIIIRQPILYFFLHHVWAGLFPPKISLGHWSLLSHRSLRETMIFSCSVLESVCVSGPFKIRNMKFFFGWCLLKSSSLFWLRHCHKVFYKIVHFILCDYPIPIFIKFVIKSVKLWQRCFILAFGS